MPVARNVWQHVEEAREAAVARRLTIRKTSTRLIGWSVKARRLATLRNRGPVFSSRIPARSRYASRYAPAL